MNTATVLGRGGWGLGGGDWVVLKVNTSTETIRIIRDGWGPCPARWRALTDMDLYICPW